MKKYRVTFEFNDTFFDYWNRIVANKKLILWCKEHKLFDAKIEEIK